MLGPHLVVMTWSEVLVLEVDIHKCDACLFQWLFPPLFFFSLAMG